MIFDLNSLTDKAIVAYDKYVVHLGLERWHWKTTSVHLPFSWQVVYGSCRGSKPTWDM